MNKSIFCWMIIRGAMKLSKMKRIWWEWSIMWIGASIMDSW